MNSLFSYNIPVQPSFQSVLIPLLKRLKNDTLILILLQYHSLTDSIELAKYLISIKFEQAGLDMMVRLKKYEDVFSHLINANKVHEALLFAKRYKVDIGQLLLSLDLKEVIKKNRQIFLNFIMKN